MEKIEYKNVEMEKKIEEIMESVKNNYDLFGIFDEIYIEKRIAGSNTEPERFMLRRDGSVSNIEERVPGYEKDNIWITYSVENVENKIKVITRYHEIINTSQTQNDTMTQITEELDPGEVYVLYRGTRTVPLVAQLKKPSNGSSAEDIKTIIDNYYKDNVDDILVSNYGKIFNLESETVIKKNVGTVFPMHIKEKAKDIVPLLMEQDQIGNTYINKKNNTYFESDTKEFGFYVNGSKYPILTVKNGEYITTIYETLKEEGKLSKITEKKDTMEFFDQFLNSPNNAEYYQSDDGNCFQYDRLLQVTNILYNIGNTQYIAMISLPDKLPFKMIALHKCKNFDPINIHTILSSTIMTKEDGKCSGYQYTDSIDTDKDYSVTRYTIFPFITYVDKLLSFEIKNNILENFKSSIYTKNNFKIRNEFGFLVDAKESEIMLHY